MRLHVLSDLHLEFDWEPPAAIDGAEVIVPSRETSQPARSASSGRAIGRAVGR